MNEAEIQEVVAELEGVLTGRFIGKVFQLTPLSLAIDFGLISGHFLYISSEPAAPRAYLIKRRLKDLEKESIPPAQFVQLVRAKLGGGTLQKISKLSKERIIRFSVRKDDEIEGPTSTVLIAQLTGRSANLFLVTEEDRIVATLRAITGEGQQPKDIYKPPPSVANPTIEKRIPPGHAESPSAVLDAQYQREQQEKLFQERARLLQNRLRREIQRKEKLKKNLESDLAAHGNAEEHKRLGDLLLANLATAQRSGSKVLIRDFYLDGAPLVELDLAAETSLQAEANRYFALYSRAKRAAGEVERRLSEISGDIANLSAEAQKLEQAIESRDEDALATFEKPEAKDTPGRNRGQKRAKIPGVRCYKSSDGYEILVGRGAGDNDNLTFRIANPSDLWLHSADYPGSHVVVRRRDRNEIPHRTIIEAAQLAARFSQANKDSKVVVHYTQRKFLSKPKGAARGLVRMSQFKTIVVEPKEDLQRV